MDVAMSTTAVSPAARHRSSIWRWLLAIFATGFLAVAVIAYNLVTLNSDATALRNELLGSLSVPSHTRIQGSIGPVLLSTIRAGAGFVDSLPREAILALRSIRKVSVGVYELEHSPNAIDRDHMFAEADRVMESRGWSRTVAVNDRDALVLVYFSNQTPSGSAEQVCVAVCDQHHIVVVSGKVRLEPLVELAAGRKSLARF
jgi:hypothetical protein